MATMGNVLGDGSAEIFFSAEVGRRGGEVTCWVREDFLSFLSVGDCFGEERDEDFARILEGFFFAATNSPCSHLNEFE